MTYARERQDLLKAGKTIALFVSREAWEQNDPSGFITLGDWIDGFKGDDGAFVTQFGILPVAELEFVQM